MKREDFALFIRAYRPEMGFMDPAARTVAKW
jgi:hypothetical protein